MNVRVRIENRVVRYNSNDKKCIYVAILNTWSHFSIIWMHCVYMKHEVLNIKIFTYDNCVFPCPKDVLQWISCLHPLLKYKAKNASAHL